MATLYVENVPEDLYKALRKRAHANRKSMAAEVISLLQQFVPTEAELKRRRKVIDRTGEASCAATPYPGSISLRRGNDS